MDRTYRTAVLPLVALLIAVLLGPWASPAGAADDSKELQALIDQLGDEDRAKRLQAAKKLEEIGEAAVEPLKRALKTHSDPDVRLRAALVLGAISRGDYAELKVINGNAPGYWLNRVVVSADGKQAIAAGGGVIWYDLETGKEVRRVLEVNGARPGLSLSPDGKHLLIGHSNNTEVTLVEADSGKVLQKFAGLRLGVQGVALSPDGTLAASAGRDGQVIVWDVKTGKSHRTFSGKVPGCVAFSPDGKLLAAGYQGPGTDFSVCLFGPATGKEVGAWTGHTGAVTAVRFLPDGKSLVSASRDGTLRLWEVPSGKEIRQMKHGGIVNDVAVSPDGTRALSAGFDDRSVRLWDLETGKELFRFEGHQTRVLGVAFSPDGKRAVSCDANCMVRVWRLKK